MIIERAHRFLEKLAPEGIPFPGTRTFSLIARSRFMKDYYKQVANEVICEIPDGKILDVGAGPGYLPIEIAKLNPNTEVTGIDISRDMVRLAKKNVKEAKLSDRVTFLVEDANEMSSEDSSFDLVVSTGALHHWKRPLRIINEIYRVLKKGRQAWIYDLSRDASDYIIINKLRYYGYGKIASLLLYNAVKIHSSITRNEVLSMLEDSQNKFKHYKVEKNWQSYPVLKIMLFKEKMKKN